MHVRPAHPQLLQKTFEMCVLPKLSHLAQATPTELFDEVMADDLEWMLRHGVALVAGLQGKEHLITQQHIDLAMLPYSLGGINLQAPNRGPHAAAATLGALARML